MSSFAKGNPFSFFFGDPFFWDPLFSFFLFFLALQRLARSVLDFESFVGQGQMLDERVLPTGGEFCCCAPALQRAP